MQIIADLHIHSKYSRAVSPKMDLFEIANSAATKGIQLVSTGDWTHPLWFRHIADTLQEINPGIYKLKPSERSAGTGKDVMFMLATEISSIYSEGGKVRRVHNLVFSPSISTSEKIIRKLEHEGAKLMSDGRPIIGISSKNLLELVLETDENAMLVPCHCLPPDELIETQTGLKKISEITIYDYVLSHTGKYRKVEQILKRNADELLYKITPWYYSQGIKTTGKHPFLAIKTIKKCSGDGNVCRPFGEHLKRCYKKSYEKYKREWIMADKLEVNDLICFPIIKKIVDKEYIKHGNLNIKVDKNFCLLIGYYLAEGCIDKKWGINFAFSAQETDYIDEVINLMNRVFGITHSRVYRRKNSNSLEVIFYSKSVAQFLDKNFYVGTIKKAAYKTIPNWILYLPIQKQKYTLISWYRGDNGYTSSKQLVSAINKMVLKMGIIPYISVNSKKAFNKLHSHIYKGRTIVSNHDNYQIKLSFINDILGLRKEKEFKRFNSKITRRHGFFDNNYAYLPIRKIQKSNYKGVVYNLEVKKDHSYTTWTTTVHNCWTPWFSIFGSKSGFDSINECFGNMSKHIYAVESGLSSDPIMNWQIKDLENRSIVSFSDAHSGPKLGREATVFVPHSSESGFSLQNLTYDDIIDAIKRDVKGKLKIGYTIEFFPEEGKYHWSGHRVCNVRYNARQVKEKGVICPVCHKPLTIGVENRVMDLSYKTLSNNDLLFLKNKTDMTFVYDKEKRRRPFVSMIPLLEILTELNNGSSVKAFRAYQEITSSFAPEFDILMRKTYDEIASFGGQELSDAIKIVRNRRAFVDPGYDGVFGVVKIFNAEATNEQSRKNKTEDQQTLF